MSSLRKAALLKSLPPLPPSGAPAQRRSKRRDYSPLSWDHYFERCEDVKVSDKQDVFRVYWSGDTGPVLLCLHGGGHSALSWALFAVSVCSMVDCRVLAMDLRGHGSTVTEDDSDLRAGTLVNDVLAVVSTVFPEDSTPPIVLLGHSMGGAVAVRVAASNVLTTLAGLVVLDVVEGSALESLASMQSFLRGRPKSFKSLEKAIEWSVRSGQLRNAESARVTMSGQVTRCSGGLSTAVDTVSQGLSTLTEETESIETSSTGQDTKTDHEYIWRIDLTKTEPFWQGWFTGLSKLFLSTSVPKVLLLAGVDRLDKDLSIGQMQGKFQLQVLAGCGHLIQEDLPDKVAEIMAAFLTRYKLTEAKTALDRPSPAC